jgi:predicted RNase H-like HicB family nuclease
MKAETIRKTALIQWSEEDEAFLIQSPLCPDVVAIEETEEQAWELFDDMLAVYLQAEQEGRLAKGPGRPRKNKIRFDAEIDPDIKVALADEAKGLGISLGEMVEVLFGHYRARKA